MVSCKFRSNGGIIVNAAGGSGVYQYKFGNLNWQPLSYFFGLPAGTYVVQLKDTLGCLTTQNIIITQPSMLPPSFINISIYSNFHSTTWCQCTIIWQCYLL